MRPSSRRLSLALSLTLLGCNRPSTPAAAGLAPFTSANPFASASTLQYQAPPFDRIHDGDYQPALEEGMRRQLAEVAAIVEAGPDREKDGVVRWRRVDLKRVIAERFGVDFHERYVGKLLKKLGFSHMSARPRHPGQDERIVEAFKKTSRAR